MADKFSAHFVDVDSPATGGFDVTPNDSTDLSVATRAIAVLVSGNVKVTTIDGSVLTVYIAAGGPLPLRVTRIWATGTTATGIVGLY